MALVCIAGLPGSGKSSLVRLYAENGFTPFDDFNIDWNRNLAGARAALTSDQNVVVADIEFCRLEARDRFAREVNAPVEWIFIENDPLQCAKNVLYRRFVRRENRPWGEEMRKIQELSKCYLPRGDVRPVIVGGPLP